MIKPSAPPRAAVKWILIASAGAALGCTPLGSYPPPFPPPPDWSTPLPPGVSSDAPAFRAQVAGLVPGRSHNRPRAATCYRCAVEVTIEALGDTRRINPDTAPAAGTAVARIVNLDSTDTEARFGFRPGIQAVYYLWVDRKPGLLKARWTVLQVPVGAGKVTAGHQKDLRLCHRYTPSYSDADFAEFKSHDPCLVAVNAEKSSLSHASLFSTEQLAAFVERLAALVRGELTAAEGGWISCSDGCCT